MTIADESASNGGFVVITNADTRFQKHLDKRFSKGLRVFKNPGYVLPPDNLATEKHTTELGTSHVKHVELT